MGGFDYNMKLSQARPEAVVKQLVSKYKVDANRLKSLGVGPQLLSLLTRQRKVEQKTAGWNWLNSRRILKRNLSLFSVAQ